MEEALIEMYLAGVSVRRVEDITEALWGTKVSPGTISKLNQNVYKSIEAGAWGRSAIVDTKLIMLPTAVHSTGARRLPEIDTPTASVYAVGCKRPRCTR